MWISEAVLLAFKNKVLASKKASAGNKPPKQENKSKQYVIKRKDKRQSTAAGLKNNNKKKQKNRKTMLLLPEFKLIHLIFNHTRSTENDVEHILHLFLNNIQINQHLFILNVYICHLWIHLWIMRWHCFFSLTNTKMWCKKESIKVQKWSEPLPEQ